MGIAERREREREQRRNDIIDAAEKIFFSRGFEEASMDDVAEQAELSKGTLYLYFKSKEELYLAIHLRGNQILRDMFLAASTKFDSGLKNVRAIGQAYYEYYQKYPDYFNAMIYYESRNIDYNEKNSVAMQCVALGKETIRILTHALEEGIKDGSIRPSIDARKTALCLWGKSTGIIQITAMKGEMIRHNHGVHEQELIAYSFDLIYHSLKL
jgi:TetR/AcrR family transcriptional regulator